MSFVVRNDLGKFAEKLKNLQTQDLADKVLDKVLEKGEKLARNQYAINDDGTVINSKGDTVQSSITVSSSKQGNTGKITSNGKQVAYLEFGTGITGEKSNYEGVLPKDPISFTDASGQHWTTQGWQYAYRNKQQPERYPEPFNGQEARMQMFNTAKELREYIKTDLAKDIRKES